MPHHTNRHVQHSSVPHIISYGDCSGNFWDGLTLYQQRGNSNTVLGFASRNETAHSNVYNIVLN